MRELGCGWCANPIRDGQAVTEVAERLLHDSPCLKEFDIWTRQSSTERFEITEAGRRALEEEEEEELPPLPLEQQLRKSIELGRIRDDDPVEWGEWIKGRYEKEAVRWGDLSCYERHTVERDESGKLVGGYPI